MFPPVKYVKSISRNVHYMVKDGVGSCGSGSGGGVKDDIKTTRNGSLAATTTTSTSTITTTTTTTTYITTILITTTTTIYIQILFSFVSTLSTDLYFQGV